MIASVGGNGGAVGVRFHQILAGSTGCFEPVVPRRRGRPAGKNARNTTKSSRNRSEIL
jgi:hypothetical protein